MPAGKTETLDFRRKSSIMKKTKWTPTAVAGGTVVSSGSYEITLLTTLPGDTFQFPIVKSSPGGTLSSFLRNSVPR